MKKAFTFLPILMWSCLVNAKETTAEMLTTAGPITSGTFPHFTPQGGNEAVNSKVSLRLIGKTFLKYNGTSFIPQDSNAYTYSNGRGGIPDIDDLSKDDQLFFDYSITYVYDKFNGSYNPLKSREQTFDNNNKIRSLTYASWRTATSLWKDSARYLYNYDNGKMIASSLDIWYGNMWTNSQISSIEYNGSNVSKMNSSLYQVLFQYDVDNNLTEVTDLQLTISGWQNNERHIYQYNGKNVVSCEKEKWNVAFGIWIKEKRWEYIYNGSDIATTIEYDWVSSAWQPYGRHNSQYDPSHNKLIDIWQLWNGAAFENKTREEWAYNRQNLPERMTTSTWNGSSWAFTTSDFEYHFYYQNYFPTSVQQLGTQNAVTIAAYPSPAASEVNIELHLSEMQDIQVAVYNTAGTMVAQWTKNNVNAESRKISVTGWPAGNYFVKMTGTKEQHTQQFIVMH